MVCLYYLLERIILSTALLRMLTTKNLFSLIDLSLLMIFAIEFLFDKHNSDMLSDSVVS